MSWAAETNIKGPKGDKGDPGASGSGTGNVNGPTPPVVDNRIVAWSGTSGTTIKDSGTLISDLAPVSNPVFTGDPRAPTPTTADNDTSIATTAFVKAQSYATSASVPVPATVVPVIESGTGAVGVSAKYAREDHVHPLAAGGGSGNVVGPASAVLNRIAVYADTTGKLIADGGALISGLQPVNQAVRYDVAQGLTINQMAQARSNIGALKKNYVINGAMQISQENGSTLGTTSGYYAVDMFTSAAGHGGAQSFQQVASVTPSGSPNRLRVTVTTADAAVAAGDLLYLYQIIEGLRWADLKSGSAAAKTVTVQFGVKAPAGTYCLTLRNGTRSYVAEYVIAAGEANTDVVKSVTITLDQTGTWATDNTVGVLVCWGLMLGTTFQTAANAWIAGTFLSSSNQFNFMGTNGNVFELFDVGLYEGSVAPPFVVPDYISELTACQRYWRKLGGGVTLNFLLNGVATAAGQAFSVVVPHAMRATPTWAQVGAFTNTNCGPATFAASPDTTSVYVGSSAAGLVQYYSNAGSYLSINARV